MRTVNEATIIGYLGDDPKIVCLQSGVKIANFSVATTEKWTDKKTGEEKVLTEWHRIVCFISIDFIQDYVKKGCPVYIRGSIRKREYLDKENQKKYIQEIVITKNGVMNSLDSSKNIIQNPNPDDEYPVIENFPKNYNINEL